MKILLFGGSGQLGFEIRKRAHDLNFEILAPVSSEVDVANASQVQTLVSQMRFDLVVNCAAYTAVDKAEQEPEQAFRINCDGAANAARAALAQGVRLIHISTDYVYDGTTNAPITEQATVNPLNVYGKSKLAGEQAVLEILKEKALILRTSSLHSQKGVNFVNTMVKLFAEKPVVRVVDDQYMSPTWAGWLAEAVLDLGKIPCSGVMHACCEGVVSWYQFAQAIHAWSIVRSTSQQSQSELQTISTEEFARPAARPRYSAMDCSLLSKVLGRKPIHWEKGLQAHLREISALNPQYDLEKTSVVGARRA